MPRNTHSRPRVLQIFKYYAPHVGGVEKVAQDIAEGLGDRISSTVLTSRESFWTKREAVNGVLVTRAGRVITKFSVPVAPRFPFLMKEMAAQNDILHFHLPYPWADFSYLLARPHGRVVVWWHSEIVKPKQLTKLYRPLLRQFLKRADRIIVAAPQLVENSPFLSQFKEKCRVIPIGIDATRFCRTTATDTAVSAIRARHGKKIVLFVGRLIYYKGVSYLIDAMARLGDRETTLLIVGEGPLKEELQSLAVERGVAEQVVFLGKANDEELLSYFQACHLFVLPSVANTEAFGIVQLEAMACGKPVISTDLPTGVPFVNLHDKTGIIVPPKDPIALAEAIKLILGDPALTFRYGEAGRERVTKEFTTNVMLERVMEVYKELMESTSG
jgi:glycosyltransferase involved in cell wall biosynthesis